MFENEDLSDIIRLVSDIKHKYVKFAKSYVFIILYNFRKIFSSYEISIRTEDLLVKLIAEKQWKSAR